MDISNFKIIFASLFLWAIINVFIQVILENIITFLDRTLKEEKNGIKYQNEIILLNWCKF